ncbi:MAG: amidohydrolase family protein [Ferruginibacter sp.]|nr:amidohydrolase family protein [Ferruginibacter sp.]
MYKKFSSLRVFNGINLLKGGYTLITTETGEIVDLIKGIDEEAIIYEGVICPGFVNAHCHLELSHLKNKIQKGTGLVDFVQRVMTERIAEPEVIKSAIKKAWKEMYAEGIVAVGDICNTTDTLFIKEKPGIKWKNFIEVSGAVAETAQKRVQQLEPVLKAFPDGILTPHAPYSVSSRLFEIIAKRNPPVISIHNQESAEENTFFQYKSGRFLSLFENLGIRIDDFSPTGKSSFKSWLPYFSKTPHLISVHNTFINKEDIQFAQTFGNDVWFCLCPNANMYIERELPPVDLFVNEHCKIIMGTDSLASNEKLSMVAEIILIQNTFPQIPLQVILKWATANGAHALGFTTLGYFKQGLKPGVLGLEADDNDKLTGKIIRFY